MKAIDFKRRQKTKQNERCFFCLHLFDFKRRNAKLIICLFYLNSIDCNYSIGIFLFNHFHSKITKFHREMFFRFLKFYCLKEEFMNLNFLLILNLFILFRFSIFIFHFHYFLFFILISSERTKKK